MIKVAVPKKFLLFIGLVVFLACVGYYFYQKSHVSTTTEDNFSERSVECRDNPTAEHVLSEKENYQLLLLCSGYVIPGDLTVVPRDYIFLKDLKYNIYHKVTYYRAVSDVGYQILEVAYPKIFIRSCYEENCDAPDMVDVSLPDSEDKFVYIQGDLLKGAVASYLEKINNKIIVAGYRKIAELDPQTLRLKTIIEVKENQIIGYYHSCGGYIGSLCFISSLRKQDDKKLQYKVYLEENNEVTYDVSNKMIIPKEDFTKVLEIR